MRFSPLLFMPVVFCLFVAATGCEHKRYQPAQWSSTTLPATAEKSAKSKTPRASKTLEKPTNWMGMVGKGGENVKGRGTSLPVATHRGSTMPARHLGTSLPVLGINGTTLPARQPMYQSGTTMPARKGTTLPMR